MIALRLWDRCLASRLGIESTMASNRVRSTSFVCVHPIGFGVVQKALRVQIKRDLAT